MTSPASWSDDPVLAKFKRHLIEHHGIRAFADAAALFRHFDTNNNGFISPDEWAAGMRGLGMTFSPRETEYLLLAFDKDRDGHVSLDELVAELVYPQLNRRRQRIVQHAFGDLQQRFGGQITPADLRGAFDISMHPEVRAGRVETHIIEREVAVAFGDDVVSTGDGALSEEGFRALMAGVSSTVPNDDVFDEYVTLGLHIDVAGHPTFSETARDWSATRTTRDPLEYSPHRPDDAYSKALQTLVRQKGYDQSITRRPQPDREPRVPRTVPRTWETTSRAAFNGGGAVAGP